MDYSAGKTLPMGYLEARAVDKRMRFVTAVEAGEETMAALCRR